MNELFRCIPSMDRCLEAVSVVDERLKNIPRGHLRLILGRYWDCQRYKIAGGEYESPEQLLLERHVLPMAEFAHSRLRPGLKALINASGVIIHTNMGRSVLSEDACAAVALAGGNYCNLELDLNTGGRGNRQALVEDTLRELCACEAAMVVNNNAAAILLVLDGLCSGGEVIVSRGELVEIGGNFRIPEIISKCGAILKEVGATNRTHLSDYAGAISENTRAILRVHTSNYRIIGFHSAVPLQELASLAREKGLVMVEDLGSGSLIDFSCYGLPAEPTVESAIGAGADIVTFSGDKLLGGPQCGMIAGKNHLVATLKKNPLARALRCDKLCLAALAATLGHYLAGKAEYGKIPTIRYLSRTEKDIDRAARRLAGRLRKKIGDNCAITLRKDVSRAGGGAFPQYDLPTTLVCLSPYAMKAMSLKKKLLATDPPLVGRLENDQFCLDPRTLEDSSFGLIAKVLFQALAVGASAHSAASEDIRNLEL